MTSPTITSSNSSSRSYVSRTVPPRTFSMGSTPATADPSDTAVKTSLKPATPRGGATPPPIARPASSAKDPGSPG